MFISRAALGLSILGFSISAAQASTFKIAISLMGFDATFLQDEHSPALPYQPGDPDWADLPGWSLQMQFDGFSILYRHGLPSNGGREQR